MIERIWIKFETSDYIKINIKGLKKILNHVFLFSKLYYLQIAYLFLYIYIHKDIQDGIRFLKAFFVY